MSGWIAVVVAGLGCFLLRFAMIAVTDRYQLPAVLQRCTEYVMPASFAALAAVALSGAGAGGPEPALLVAAAATAAVALRRGPSSAVLCGMFVVWVLPAVGAV